MLRIFSSKIFREDLSMFACPMYAFEHFSDVKRKMDMDSGTYKFCLPVSVGDFPEINVPACFSNKESELAQFVDLQIRMNHRKAFILSDFGVYDIADICFSGIINICSQKGLYDYYNRSTSISLTLKNPIQMYGEKGISPRDLPADIGLWYDHVSNTCCAFPKVTVKRDGLDLGLYKNIIYQAYCASAKMHEISVQYDGNAYHEYALFFVDRNQRIWLYEIVGEESFLGCAKHEEMLLNRELELVKC